MSKKRRNVLVKTSQALLSYSENAIPKIGSQLFLGEPTLPKHLLNQSTR